jgi:hypothetical protein
MFDGAGYHLRDSKAVAGPVLDLPAADWEPFCRLVATPGAGVAGELHVVRHADGRLTVRGPAGRTLRYTPTEVDCFLDGVRNREFAPSALRAA